MVNWRNSLLCTWGSWQKSVSYHFSPFELHNWDHTKLCWQKVLFLQQTSSGVTLNHYSSGAFSWPPPLHFHQKGLDLATGNDTAIQTDTSVSYVWPKFYPNESFVLIALLIPEGSLVRPTSANIASQVGWANKDLRLFLVKFWRL